MRCPYCSEPLYVKSGYELGCRECDKILTIHEWWLARNYDQALVRADYHYSVPQAFYRAFEGGDNDLQP